MNPSDENNFNNLPMFQSFQSTYLKNLYEFACFETICPRREMNEMSKQSQLKY